MSAPNTRIRIFAVVELGQKAPTYHFVSKRLLISDLFPMSDQHALIRGFRELQHMVERDLFDEVFKNQAKLKGAIS